MPTIRQVDSDDVTLSKDNHGRGGKEETGEEEDWKASDE